MYIGTVEPIFCMSSAIIQFIYVHSLCTNLVELSLLYKKEDLAKTKTQYVPDSYKYEYNHAGK